jgi:hypothetical protein
MCRTLLSIMILTLCPLLFGALQTLPARIFYPSLSLFTGSGTIQINDDTDEMSYAFAFPKTGTCTAASLTTATITTGDTAVPFRVETVGTDGNASGTLYHANATGTMAIADADDNVVLPVSFNGGTGFPCTAGDIAILRWKRDSVCGTPCGDLNGQFRFATSFTSLNVASIPGVSDFNVTAGAAWTRQISSQPLLALNIGGWALPPGCLGGISGAAATDAFQLDDERGILINTPISMRVVGATFIGTIAAATTIKLSLYSDPTGTPDLETATATIDTDVFQTGVGNRGMAIYFTAPETLTASTDYVLALSPQGAVNVSITYFPTNATYAAAYHSGSTGVWQSRANVADAFTPNTGRIPIMALIVDQIDTGSAGGKFISDLNESPLDGLRDFWLRLNMLRYKRMLWRG